MTLTLAPLGEALGIAADGIDLGGRLGGTTTETLRRALLDHLVLCVRGQSLTPKGYLAAAGTFGRPITQVRVASRHPEIAEIMILSSEDRDAMGDGRPLVVGAHWHSDDSYRAVPCSLTMLYGIEVPESGGDTQFANMYAAYEDLPAATKREVAGLRVVHRYESSRRGARVMTLGADEAATLPEVTHPLVRIHPETGRPALYLNPNRMEGIVGLARAESDRLLDALIAHAVGERYQYRHRWRQGDVLIWDNRCTMHKANGDYPLGARRFMHRIMVEGTVPIGPPAPRR
jgi:taurine dioxygenase